ncbi:MAG: hypothetical protein ACHBN1_12875 [Heteroscytonema crispum UTEX LB 1556]
MNCPGDPNVFDASENRYILYFSLPKVTIIGIRHSRNALSNRFWCVGQKELLSTIRSILVPYFRRFPPEIYHQRPFGRTSTSRGTKSAVRASPLTTHFQSQIGSAAI